MSGGASNVAKDSSIELAGWLLVSVLVMTPMGRRSRRAKRRLWMGVLLFAGLVGAISGTTSCAGAGGGSGGQLHTGGGTAGGNLSGDGKCNERGDHAQCDADPGGELMLA